MNGYTLLGTTASRENEDATVHPITSDADARNSAVSYLASLVGTPYVWAGKNPSEGLDCSGAVMVAYEHAGIAKPGARYKYGSADLHKVLAKTTNPRPGDLAFYGSNNKVSHVMMVADRGRVLGATGGGPKTKTADDARAIGAYVKYKPWDYRKDLISYGIAPTVYSTLDGSNSTRVDTSDTRSEVLEKVGYGILATVFVGAGAWVARWYSRRSA